MKRSGFALFFALVAVLVLAALAALANIAAVAAIRESSAQRDDARASAAREALRTRMTRLVSGRARSELLGGRLPLGGGDSALAVTPLAWPWHRLEVFASGRAVVAEVARAGVPQVAWCAAAVTGGVALVAPSTMEAGDPAPCPPLAVEAPGVVAALDGTLDSVLVLHAPPDSLFVDGSIGLPVVWRARRTIRVGAGGTILGLVIAPVIRIESGASVRGLVVAAESLVVEPGALVTADRAALAAAMSARARLVPLGRRGLLLPP